MKNEVWVLGATGRTGRGIAARLREKEVPLVLVGRDRARLEALAAELGGETRSVAGTLEETLGRLTEDAPAVVVNTIGPFTTTAPRVIKACPPGTHYLDLSNEFPAAEIVLDLNQKAIKDNQTLITGAGFGVLATESALLRLCEGQPTAKQVRVDAIASVAIEPGTIGTALAASILEALSFGGREIRQGRVVRTPLVANAARVTTPEGEVITTGGTANGELLAAWHASKAENVVATMNAAPTGLLARIFVPVVALFFRIPAFNRFATRRIAGIKIKAKARPRPYSWGHARAEWPNGEIKEAWLRAGEGMDFTCAVAAEVAYRLYKGEGRPGAYTPGALFGPSLAEAAGGEFIIN